MLDSSSLDERKAIALRERQERVYGLLEGLRKQRDLETRVEEKARLDALIEEKENDLRKIEGESTSGDDSGTTINTDALDVVETPASMPSPPTQKSRLERLMFSLGVAVALLTIAGAVLDLPGKWKAWRTNVVSPASTSKQILQGQVLDHASGQPLAGALVAIRGHGSMRTADMGEFSIEVLAVKNARVRVTISMAGFVEKNEDPMVGLGQIQIYRLNKNKD